MENYKEMYEKAQFLMRSALEKYSKGDFKGGEEDRKKANQLFDMAELETNSEMYKTSMLYGENKNFGIIYKIIESNSKKLFENKGNHNKLRKLYNLIKENKCLKQQFRIYNAFTEKNSISDTGKFVNEALSLNKTMNLKDIRNNNQKLIDIIRESKLDEMICINDDEMKLYNSIEYAITHKKNLSNLNEYMIHENNIKQFMDSNKDTSEKVKDIDECVNEIAEKYNNILNDDEINLLKKISVTENKEELFNKHKENLLEALNNEISNCNDEDKNGWQNIYETINKKEYDNENFITDICKMIEIENTIN